MSTVRRLGTLLREGGARLTQHLLSLFRGQGVHLILTGPDPVGLNYLTDLLRGVQPESCSAMDTATRLAPLMMTADLDDITRATEIVSSLGKNRRIVVVTATADPRQMVCRSDERLGALWPDAADYRFLIGEGGLKSFTEPGVIPRCEGLEHWQSLPGVAVVSISREQLESDPSSALRGLAESLSGRHSARLVAALKAAAQSAKPLEKQPGFLDAEVSLKRLASQLAHHPKLAEIAGKWGYPPLGEKALPPVSGKRGTVIAFHTPDEVYRAEAARLRSTLEALGVEYRFFEVTPENNWVRTTLLKPSWILSAREQMEGPLLYIDVDAFVHHDPWPYLEHLDGDMGAVVYRNGQLNSATLWINDTDNARDILRRWKDAADNRRDADQGDLEPTGDNGDQGVLKQVVLADEASAKPVFVFHRLPVNLAYIFDRTDTYRVGPVVIEQLQVSRESLGHDKRLARRRERLLELDRAQQNPTRA